MPQDRVLVTPLLLFVLVALAAAGAALFMSVNSAHAEVTGPCVASIAGVDVAGVDSGNRDHDIHVSQDQSVAIGAVSPVGFASHKIMLEFAGQRWTVSDEDDGGSNSWSGTVNVDDYATWGVGLYKVIGVSTLVDGSTCEGAATVDVDGNPLTTVAGAGAAAVLAVGTVGALATTTVAAARNPGPLGRYDDVWQGLDRVSDARAEQQAQDEAAREAAERARKREAATNILTFLDAGYTGMAVQALGCVCFAAIALIMTPLMALTGGGAGGEGEPTEAAQPTGGDESGPGKPAGPAERNEPTRLPRAPWLPRITLLGLVSGLIAGAGAVVLLQQYSIQYPTLGVIITWVLVGMAVYGIVLPTIGYTISWMRVNGRISRLEKELQ